MKVIPSGTVTTPKGFQAGAVFADIKGVARDKPDLGILYSEVPAVAAGVFTRNRIRAAPVVLCQQRLKNGRARAIIANSGCANAGNGAVGRADAETMAALAAREVGVSADEVLVASTGVIGWKLPIEKIKQGVGRITLSRDGGHQFTQAIMTTDTVPKEIAVRADGFTIGGVAKGSGMIHPDMATLLGFLTTDASVAPGFLKVALRRAVAISFNMVSIDGDTSTNDTVLVLANGTAGGKPISAGSPQAGIFQDALNYVCIHLAKMIARDGEGATRLIEVTVRGSPTLAEARQVARTIVSSPLVKSAVHGGDPNWGRVLAAAGRSGVAVVEDKIDLAIGGVSLLKAGRHLPFAAKEVSKLLGTTNVPIDINLNLGKATATAWGCDLSEEYVTINSQYTT